MKSKKKVITKKGDQGKPPKKAAALKAYPLWWALLTATLYFILLFIGILYHEPWRDELQAWQITLASHSIPQLFYNLRYEGHPAFWYLLLYPITLFTRDYFYMQLLHILLATLVAYLVLRYATFPFWMRLLIIFGYYTFYEYAVISRSYVLGELATVMFCIVWIRWKNKISSASIATLNDYMFPALALLLMANISSYNLVEAGGFSIFIFIWVILEKKDVLQKINYSKAGIAILTILAGAILCYIQIKPLPDNTFLTHPPNGFDPGRIYFTLAFIIPAYFPVPDLNQFANWNTFYYTILPELKFGIMAMIVLFVLFISFQDKRKILLMFFVLTFSIASINYYIAIIGIHYDGQLWFIFIAALWFYYDKDKSTDRPLFPFLKNLSFRTRRIFFPGVLIIQCAVGFYFYFRDLRQPFSNLSEAGKYVQQPSLRNLTIIGIPDYMITPLSYFTGNPVFTGGRKRFSSYAVWNGNWKANDVKLSDVFVQDADSLLSHLHKDSLLVCFPIPIMAGDGKSAFIEADLNEHLHLKALAEFNKPAMVFDELYFFYLATRINKSANN